MVIFIILGLYFQPFAEYNENEIPIPKIAVEEQILRCKLCASYINSKYKMISKSNKAYAVCNICQGETELNSSKPGVKPQYFSSDFSNTPELNTPTVDFFAPPNLKHNNSFSPRYFFMIDISQVSKETQFASYVL